MSSTIYNEGRVVGFSAYEIYVRHALCEDPTTTPASELEWLSSSIATGSSMLLKIPAETGQNVSGHHIINIPLPANTNLAAANTIIGSLFLGDAEVDADGWATKVTSYGLLIENNATNPTAGDHSADTTIPPTTYTTPLSDEYQDRLLNYVKVVDGIVVQPGHWSANEQSDQPPHKDFSPDLGARPFVKIYVSDTITEDFYVLLTGFTLRTVLAGVSGLNGSTDTDTNFKENGGFLGPAVFPWANKIVFSVPPAYVNYFIDKRYTRSLQYPADSTTPESYQPSQSVKAVAVIDMEEGDPATYYSGAGSVFVRYDELKSRPDDWADCYTQYFVKQGSSLVPVSGATAPDATGDWPKGKYYQKVTPYVNVDISEANASSGDRVLTVYQRNDALPPALYATKVSATGQNKLSPVDVVAPGTVKMYEGETAVEAATKLEDAVPGNRAFIRDTEDYVLKELDDEQGVIPVADVSTIELDHPLTFEDVLGTPIFVVKGDVSRDGSTTPTGTITDLGNAKPFAITLRRFTGKLSSKIKNQCGYEYDDAVFDTGGIWESANKSLMEQIPEGYESDYYYVVNAQDATAEAPYVFPVRKSDHIVDVVIPYETRIYVNGTQRYPIFVNPDTGVYIGFPVSSAIGSYLEGENFNEDETLAGVGGPAYQHMWGYIVGDDATSGAAHPTRKGRLPNFTGQIDTPTAILPADDPDMTFEQYYDYEWMREWFPPSYLSEIGIADQYHGNTITQFLRTAQYTDMGTGELLSESDPNRDQTIYIYSHNAAPGTTLSPVVLPILNSAENSGKPIYIPLPSGLEDSIALGVHIETGKKKATSLSLSDSEGNLYNFNGDSGENVVPEDGNISWNDLLYALANNQSIDLFSSSRFLRELGLRLSAGLGIAINWDSKQRKYVITNTMPYNPAGQGYSRIYQSNASEQKSSVDYAHGGFDCISYNGWRSVDGRAYQWWGDGETFYEGSSNDTYGYPYNASDSGHGNSYYNTHLNLHSKNLHSDPNDTNGGAVRPVPRIGVSVLPATYMDYKKIVCPAEPEDWEECWKYYYYELVGEEYVDLATKYRELLESPPDDWSTNYFNYYTYDSELNKCSLIPASDRGAPAFQLDTYYKSIRPTWQGDTFTELSVQPSDWETYEWYNNTKYYVKIQDDPEKYAIYPRALLTYDSQTQEYQPPNFSDTTFYTRNDDAIFYVGYPNNVSVRLSGDTSYKSITSGKTYSYQLALPPRLPYVSTNDSWNDGAYDPDHRDVVVGSICKGFYVSVNNEVDTSDGFLFAHNEGITSNTGKHSVMFGVKFTGKYAFLNHTQDMTSFTGKLTGNTLLDLVPNNDLVYNLTTTTLGTSGIWNVKRIHPNHYLKSIEVGTPPNTSTKYLRFFDLQSFDDKHRLNQYVSAASTSLDTWTTVDAGAAWGATCNIYPGPVYGYKTSTFIVSAAAYADGHNSQMVVWTGDDPGISGYSWDNMRGMDMTSLLTNLNITGLFYLS